MKKLMLLCRPDTFRCAFVSRSASAPKSLTLWTADDLAGSWGATPVSVFEAGAVDKAVRHQHSVKRCHTRDHLLRME